MRRPLVRQAVETLPIPEPALLRPGDIAEGFPLNHDVMAARVPALRLIETLQPVASCTAPPEQLRVAAWNLERCTEVTASAALLRGTGASVAMLSEMDLGMARSGNRHTTRDLAHALDAGYVFGVEFVELGIGHGRELDIFNGQTNSAALHGNAVLTRHSFHDPFMVALDQGGAWFNLDWHHPRLGGRMAIGATVELVRGPVVLVSVHLENRSTPEERRDAVERLVAALGPDTPAVVAGDFNTARMPDPEAELTLDWFVHASSREPLFSAMYDAGFDWIRCNAPDQTRRIARTGDRVPPPRRMDWFFTRGLEATNPTTWSAVDVDGMSLSDHELITVDIR